MNLRLGNAPYMKFDLFGRVLFNIYRTGSHRKDTTNPVIRWVHEDRAYHKSRGIFVHIGRVGTYVAYRSR